jgi:large subunit ribosomal protein L4
MTDSIKIDLIAADGSKTGQLELPGDLFDAPANLPLIHQVVVAQQAAARQGTHATKTRGEVSGGGAKPWRQKGTGRARQGSRRAPQWTGGGVVHGPQPRSYAQRTPKKMIAAALRAVLSDRARDGRLFVVDSIVSGELPSTRQALKTLDGIGSYTSAIVVLHRDEDLAWLSLRNVVNVHAIAVDQLNSYDVLVNQTVVFTQAALNDYLTRQGLAPVQVVKAPRLKAKAAKAAEPVESGEPVDQAADDQPAEAESETKPKAESKPKAKRTVKPKAEAEAEPVESAEPQVEAEPVAEDGSSDQEEAK